MKNTAHIIRFLLFAILVSIGTVAMAQPEWVDILGTIGGGIALAIVPVADIARSSNEERSPNQIKNRLWYIAADQVDTSVNFPTPNAQRKIGSIPLLSGQYWHYFDIIKDSANPKTTVNNTDFAYELLNNIEFYLGGNSVELLNLIEDGMGQDFFLVYENCGTGEKWLLGTNCKPMTLEDAEEFSQESLTGWRVMFDRTSSKLKYIYTGTLPTISPTLIAADATDVVFDGSEQYKFSSNTVATAFLDLTGLTSADVGSRFDLLGADAPASDATTIAAGGNFLLYDGTIWTANTGSKITFEVFKDGAATYKFIEVGTRIQT